VGGETFQLGEARGSLVHYWGRRLTQAWLCVSADGVGEDDATDKAAIFRSRLWATHGPTINGAYVLVKGGGGRHCGGLSRLPRLGDPALHPGSRPLPLRARGGLGVGQRRLVGRNTDGELRSH